MCGIFGILYHDEKKAPRHEQLQETANLLRHRGPDGDGIFADQGIGLVHTRLSLVDLNERSNQPFWDASNRHVILFNGEIYNFRELKAELHQKGIPFRTTSDTEVLLQCLIHLGLDATLPRLEGMFAFAWYDTKEKTLVLARDRFGMKPLHIYNEPERFMFASEIRALRPWLRLRPDFLSISSYLQGFGGPTQGHSFYEGVTILPPGSIVQVRMGSRAESHRFFTMRDFWDPGEADVLRRLKPSQIVDKVEETLMNGVKSQMFADAPVGSLCSGGVDSSLITAMAAKVHNNLAIFHANVVGPLSEHEAATALAKHLRLDLKAASVQDHDFIETMPDVAEHYGHPFSIKPSSIPFLMVSRLVHRHGVKAVLSGEGSDECFLGYYYLVPNLSKVLRRFPRRAFQSSVEWFKVRRPRWKPRHASEGMTPGDLSLVRGLHNRFEYDLETADLASVSLSGHGDAIPKPYQKSLHALTYNLRSLLHRNDCMGMAASIESRFPFLDNKLVKLAVNMPYDCKIRLAPTFFEREHPFLRDKWALRQVADRYLPPELSRRKKLGFPTDAFRRMRIRETFFDNSHVANWFGISQKQTRYLVERASPAFQLRLLQLEIWAHVCLHALPKAPLVQKLRKYVTIAPHSTRMVRRAA